MTRFSTALLAEDWLKVTWPPLPMEKSVQLMTARWLDCVTVIWPPEAAPMTAVPWATVPPVGRVWAAAEPASAAAMAINDTGRMELSRRRRGVREGRMGCLRTDC